ncbi:TonB-dependent receptor plug domain-containing protein [Flavobacterium suaedae]|nr:TonB-dependent receptor [Flavobacterium suaedae]
MALRKLGYIFLLLLCQYVCAQTDSITQLKEVVISDTQLKDFSKSQQVWQLNDSIINRSPSSLGALLNYNTVIYFKENGLGMVSSPSFRGTNAQQTAVIWNGININSQLNGQTDFNIINTRDFDEVSVRAGGGSVIYGSSAIGGSIHLNNELRFKDTFDNTLFLSYGSYNTQGLNYKLNVANKKFSSSFAVSRNSSDNDYEYPSGIINENGQYYNTSLNASFGYKLNEKNILRLYSYFYDGDRHFSRTVSAPSLSKYKDYNTRNLLEWMGIYGKFTSKLKAAYLTENYKYYARYTNDNYTFGEVKTYIGRYDLAYQVTDNIKLNTLLNYTVNKGKGSDIDNKNREIASGSLLLQHSVTPKLQYEAGVRKEITNAYESPLLFSLGGSYQVASFYTVKLNASRNFRIPTYNDLYWQGSGNPNLNPETSYQGELGNEFRVKNIKLTVTGYYIRMHDMLRWVPGSDNIWRPENVDKAKTYGIESVLNWDKKLGNHHFTIDATYAYTVSQRDGSTNQLIYVPFHKATAAVGYSYKGLGFYYRHLYNGKVYYTSDNVSQVDAYNVSTIGAEYQFKFLGGLTVGAQVRNLWAEEYENVRARPLPGRNYTMYLNFKF